MISMLPDHPYFDSQREVDRRLAAITRVLHLLGLRPTQLELDLLDRVDGYDLEEQILAWEDDGGRA